MPRQGRLHIPGGYYHVMGRGLERRRIFDQPEDKRDFLSRLGEGLERSQSQCFAWAIMSNHYHLLIRVSSEPLHKLMSPLLSGYATQYNYRKKRSGYVFQNRYKSILVDADNYLLELIRYIHLNPLKAKIVKSLSELDRFPWSGHAGLLGRHVQTWHSISDVLALFSKQAKSARTIYRQFVSDGIKNANHQDLSGGGLVRSYGGWEAVKYLRKEHEARIGDERILGDSGFVEAVLKNDNIDIDQRTKLHQQGWDISRLIDEVCAYCEVSPADIMKKGRQNNISNAKNLICYWGTQVLGLASSELTDYLKISQPSISKARKRGEDYCRQFGIKWEDVVNG